MFLSEGGWNDLYLNLENSNKNCLSYKKLLNEKDPHGAQKGSQEDKPSIAILNLM